MDLFEYQARDLFATHGVPVLPGAVACNAEEARRVAERLNGRAVVKAQVKVGGRGKAGGVALAESPAEAAARADAILGMNLNGHEVGRVLVTEASKVTEEYYFAFLLDRANRSFLAMASSEGGVEVEELATERPDALAQVPIDPIAGLDKPKAVEILRQGGFPDAIVEAAADAVLSLWTVFTAEDATLVEVNPLVRDSSDNVIALDGKVTLDDNAGIRHPGHIVLAEQQEQDPLEAKAKTNNLNYVKLDGAVGIVGNGAGLVMSTLDVVAHAGERHGGVRPANFLDIGGGASAEVMAAALDITLGDKDVRSVFVNVFGGITACDAVAEGILRALALLERRGEPVDKPLIVRLDGNNADEGRRILRDADLPAVTLVETMDNAADRSAELAVTGK